MLLFVWIQGVGLPPWNQTERCINDLIFPTRKGMPSGIKQARLILELLEERLQVGNGLSANSEQIRESATLEHVFSKTLDARAKFGMDQDEFLSQRHTIGNLILLTQSENSSASDRDTLIADTATGREGKLSIYSGSHFSTTRAMAGGFETQRKGRGANAYLLNALPILTGQTQPQDIAARGRAITTALLKCWGHSAPAQLQAAA